MKPSIIKHDNFTITAARCEQMQGNDWVEVLSCTARTADGRIFRRTLPGDATEAEIINDYLENRYCFWWLSTPAGLAAV